MRVSSPPVGRPSLASFWHDLPREGRLLLSTVIVEFLGTGLVMPFTVVYLSEVRRFGLEQAGALLAIPAVVGLLVVGPAGTVIDRVGARRVVLATLCCLVVSSTVLAFATTPAVAAVGLAFLGMGHGVSWPAANALIGSVIPSGLRQRYFGINFTLLNLGIGIGGVLGGRLVDVTRPGTFTALYLLDAATYLAPVAILLGPLRHASGKVEAHAEEALPGVTYAVLLRDRRLLTLLGMSLVAAFVGYAQLNSGMPAFARAAGGVSTEAIGYAFGVNTLVIVLLQLVVLQRIEGRRRTRVAMVMALTWGLSWLLLGATALVPGTVAAVVLLAGFAGVFGLGETMLQPTLAAMTNDLSPDHLRGRYNALGSLTFQLAFVAGPLVAGLLIGRGLAVAYVGLLVAGCAVLAWAALLTERRLPPHVNGLRLPRRSHADGVSVRPGERHTLADGTPRGGTSPNSPRVGMQQG